MKTMGRAIYQAVKLSALNGARSWGIEDVRYNGDNLIRDWRYKGNKRRIWRGTEEEAKAVATYLCDHPEILDRDAKRTQDTRTRAILAHQRRIQRNKPPTDHPTLLDLDLTPTRDIDHER